MCNKTIIVIPARYASSRFPGKLLKDLCGQSVLERTWQAARHIQADITAIAVDHPLLAEHAEKFGAKVIRTGACRSGSDRVYEATKQLHLQDNDLVINLQGDEPLFHPHDIRLLSDTMHQNANWHIGSMMHPITDYNRINDPSTVKVVTSASNIALYFSRSAIPFAQKETKFQPMLHQGIYAYRLQALRKFVSLPPCALEQCEQLEQLRALFYNMHIHMITSQHPAHCGIDTPQDLALAKRILENTATTS